SEHEHENDLKHEGDTEHDRAYLNARAGEQEHNHEEHEASNEPVKLYTEELRCDDHAGEESDGAERAGDEGVVADRRNDAGDKTRGFTEALDRDRVKATSVRQLLRDLCIANSHQ